MVALGFVGALVAQDAGKQTDKQARQSPKLYLQQASIFGFGVKLGQDPSSRKSDTAYSTLMAYKDAKQQFSEVFEKGTIHGKCYALCAMHDLDKKLFAKLASTMDPNAVVQVRDGCVYDEKTVKEIIKAIEDGRYAFMYKKQ